MYYNEFISAGCWRQIQTAKKLISIFQRGAYFLSNVFQFLLAAIFLIFLAGVALFLPVPEDDKRRRKFLKIVSLFAYLVAIFVFRDLIPEFLINLFLIFNEIPYHFILALNSFSIDVENIIYLFFSVIFAFFSLFFAKKALFLPVKNSEYKNLAIISKIFSLYAFTMLITHSLAALLEYAFTHTFFG
jgi:hypothetical protein